MDLGIIAMKGSLHSLNSRTGSSLLDAVYNNNQ